MAIIPRNQESVQMKVSSPVPIAGTGDARIPGEAIASLGAAVENFGKQQLEVQRSLNKEEGFTKIQETYQQAHLYAHQNAAEDGSDYQQKVNEYTQDKLPQITNQYASGDPRLQREFGAYQAKAQAESTTTGMIESAKRLESSNTTRMDNLANQDADFLRENPNPNLFSAKQKTFNSMMDGLQSTGAVSAPQAAKTRARYNTNLAQGYLEGLGNTEQWQRGLDFLQAATVPKKDAAGNAIEGPALSTPIAPEEAHSLGLIDAGEMNSLKAKGENYQMTVMKKTGQVRLSPEETSVSNGLDPEARQRLIAHFQAKLKESTAVNVADLNRNVTGFHDMALRGERIDPAAVANLQDQIFKSQLTPVAKNRLVDGLQTSMAVNSRLQTLEMTPRRDYEKVISGVEHSIAAQGKLAGFDIQNDFAMQSNRARTVAVLPEAAKAIMKEQDADGAAFFEKRDPKLQLLKAGTKDGDPQATQAYVSTLVARQRYIGMSPDKIRVMSKPDAAALATQFVGTQDAGAKNELLQKVQDQYGSYLPSVMNELGKVNKDVGKLKIATFMEPELRLPLIDALTNEKQINEAFKTKYGSNEELKSGTINSSIEEVAGPLTRVYATTSDNSQGLEFSNNVKKVIALQVKRDAMKEDSPDLKKLTQDAYDRVIGANFNIVSGDKSSLMVPKKIDGQDLDPKYVQSYLNVYTQAVNLPDLKVFVPPNFKDHQEVYYDSLAKTAKWVMNATGTGTRLMAVPPGEMRYRPVQDNNGQIIERTFRQINRGLQDIEATKVLDDTKSITTKMFEGVGRVTSKVMGGFIDGGAVQPGPAVKGNKF